MLIWRWCGMNNSQSDVIVTESPLSSINPWRCLDSQGWTASWCMSPSASSPRSCIAVRRKCVAIACVFSISISYCLHSDRFPWFCQVLMINLGCRSETDDPDELALLFCRVFLFVCLFFCFLVIIFPLSEDIATKSFFTSTKWQFKSNPPCWLNRL